MGPAKGALTGRGELDGPPVTGADEVPTTVVEEEGETDPDGLPSLIARYLHLD